MSGRVAMSLSLAGLAVVLSVSAANAQVLIDPSVAGHQLTNTGWTPDNNNAPFWDNISADGSRTATNCSVGFYALGTMHSGCQNAILGTFGYMPGSNPYGYTTNGPVRFGFVPGVYEVTLLGGLHGARSWIFTYGCSNDFSSCNLWLDDLFRFNDSGVGYTYLLDYSSLRPDFHWGLGYVNSFNTSDGCFGAGYYCTSNNDGTSMPLPGQTPQFFALFESNSTCSWGQYCYLVGVEDNNLEYISNVSSHDSDYQDWLIRVNPVPEPGTIALIATGLVGLAGAGMIQRRRKD